jgi:hypothetical protein
VATPEKVLNQNLDVVENMTEDYPYDTMKVCLLDSHTLSNLKKMDIFFKSELLGHQKPSLMLVNMLTYCTSSMEQSIMFQHMFLQHLSVTFAVATGACGHQKPGGQGRQALGHLQAALS